MGDFIRPFFSFDYDDILSLVGVVFLGWLWYRSKRVKTSTSETHETVDASVLAQFAMLYDRISKLEAELSSTQDGLARALEEIVELKRLEAYLDGKLHEKDSEIRSLRQALNSARKRIRELESLCKSYGIERRDFEPFNGSDQGGDIE